MLKLRRFRSQIGDPATIATQVSSKYMQLNGNGKANGTTNGNANSHKSQSLRDAIHQAIPICRTELGFSSGEFLSSVNSVGIFFDYVAGIRLRQMPHSSSMWNKVLKLAEFFAAQVAGRLALEEAIHLCEDICYNLHRVWVDLDATTLEMHNLLSSFYRTVGNYRRDMLVHEDLLREAAIDEELPPAEAAAIAVQQLELLERSYQRLGGWDKEQQIYFDLYQQLTDVFTFEDGWKKAQTRSVETWQFKGADDLGTWTKPDRFVFMATESRKHAKFLRESSGTWTLCKHSHGRSSKNMEAIGAKIVST
ncbi:hypothetical protein JHW43_006377 [Diplocarpon mali]|nr:hypothetical protein JHW43_006377 [Diplocarpon mali]